MLEFSLPKYQSKRAFPVNSKDEDQVLFNAELVRSYDEVNLISEKNAWVYPEQTILRNGEPVSTIQTRTNHKSDLNWKIKSLRKKKEELQRAFWLTDVWSNNYFHWFTEVLPRVLVIEKEFADVPLLIPKFYQDIAFVSESLKAFNIDIIWIPSYKKVLVKELLYLPTFAPSGNYRDELMVDLSKKVRQFFNLDQIKPDKRILISRQNAPSRRILNCSELEMLYRKYNIEEIVFENLSWKKQIQAVASAKLLIGVHGAGLTNMLFGNIDTKILELRRQDDRLNNCYFALSSALNMKYYYQLCKVDDPAQVTQKNNFKVDANSFEQILNEITE